MLDAAADRPLPCFSSCSIDPTQFKGCFNKILNGPAMQGRLEKIRRAPGDDGPPTAAEAWSCRSDGKGHITGSDRSPRSSTAAAIVEMLEGIRGPPSYFRLVPSHAQQKQQTCKAGMSKARGASPAFKCPFVSAIDAGLARLPNFRGSEKRQVRLTYISCEAAKRASDRRSVGDAHRKGSLLRGKD